MVWWWISKYEDSEHIKELESAVEQSKIDAAKRLKQAKTDRRNVNKMVQLSEKTLELLSKIEAETNK